MCRGVGGGGVEISPITVGNMPTAVGVVSAYYSNLRDNIYLLV